MNQFTTKYDKSLQFVLSGFDRLVLRGTIRRLSFVEGLAAYLQCRHVLLKDFGDFVAKVTTRIKEASLAGPRAHEVPVA